MTGDRYASGRYSLKEITKLAAAEGLCNRKSRKPDHKSAIHKIVTNRLYYGDFEWKGKLYRGSHEAIISKELFDNAQMVLRGNGHHRPRSQKHSWAFQGLITCGHCGCAMVAMKKKEKYIYYHCTGNVSFLKLDWEDSMKKIIITIGLLFLIAGCAHKHAKYVESGVLRRDINKQAFLDVWGPPERTRVVTFRDEDESTSLGWNFGGGGGGGGLFKGKRSRSFEEWSYEKFGVTLLFSGYGLVDWKTDKTTEQLKALAEKSEYVHERKRQMKEWGQN